MPTARLHAALEGRISLGLMAVSHRGTSKWLVLDADDAYTFERLVHLAAGLDPRNTLVETSRRGGHIWFFHPPVGWLEANAYGRFLLRKAGIEAEVYPKGPGLGGVRVPGAIHPKTGETYPIIDPATGEMLDLAEKLNILQPLPLPEVPELYRLEPKAFRPMHGTQSHQELVEAVSRYTTLRQIGPDRYSGLSPLHDDHNPSLGIVSGFVQCWTGCVRGGLLAWNAAIRRAGLEPRL